MLKKRYFINKNLILPGRDFHVWQKNWAIYEAFLLKWERLIETLRSAIVETFLPYIHLPISDEGKTGKLMTFAVVLSMGLI